MTIDTAFGATDSRFARILDSETGGRGRLRYGMIALTIRFGGRRERGATTSLSQLADAGFVKPVASP
jgi:hypothetical protein